MIWHDVNDTLPKASDVPVLLYFSGCQLTASNVPVKVMTAYDARELVIGPHLDGGTPVTHRAWLEMLAQGSRR